MIIITNNYVYRCLNEYNEIIYVGKLIKLQDFIQDYFKDELLNKKILLYTYKIEAIKVDYEIDTYYISAYLIDKYKPKYNTQKHHYKNIKLPNIYNESNWELVRIINPDRIPIQENNSFLDEYFHLLIILIVLIIILGLYINRVEQLIIVK